MTSCTTATRCRVRIVNHITDSITVVESPRDRSMVVFDLMKMVKATNRRRDEVLKVSLHLLPELIVLHFHCPNYDDGLAKAVLEAARKAVLALGGQTLMQALEQSGAADDACVIQAFSRMAPLVSESSLRGKNAGGATSLTPQRLREMMRDPRYFDPSRRDAEFVRQVQKGFESLYPGEQAPTLRAS